MLSASRVSLQLASKDCGDSVLEYGKISRVFGACTEVNIASPHLPFFVGLGMRLCIY